MSDFATLQDVIDLFRPLTADETAKVEKLLPLVSDALRVKARAVNKDLDQMIIDDPNLASVATMVTVSIVGRALRQDTEGEPLSQFSQSAMGYSFSGTPIMAGGGVSAAILKNDLKALGLRCQTYGALEIYGND